MGKELANEIYIFTSPGMPGIKFYDRSPDGAVAKFAGSLPKGTYQTDIYSISQVSWDREINRPNKSQLVTAKDGSYTATTIIVSPEQLMRILHTIENSEDKSCIKIDVVENKYAKDNSSNVEELEALKKELLSKMQSSNINENNYSNQHIDNIVGKNVKYNITFSSVSPVKSTNRGYNFVLQYILTL